MEDWPMEQSVGRKVKYHLNWEEFDSDVRFLAGVISRCGREFGCIYGIPRGGLVIAVRLSHLLEIPLSMVRMADIATLVVDDVSDTGHTLKQFKREYPLATTATLHRKDGTIFEPDFCVRTINRWIVYPYERE